MEGKPEEIPALNFESDIVPKILDAQKKRKGYASFFDWPNKATKEKRVVRDLLEAIEAKEGSHDIVKIRSNQSDPPDCIGTTNNGEYVGFEVTELVDLETVKMNRRGLRVCKDWTPAELLEKLRAIIKNKDAKIYQGVSCSKIILVIFTDEPMVRFHDCDAIFRDQILGQCRNITDCYLLFSYQPGQKFYPYFKLEVSRLV